MIPYPTLRIRMLGSSISRPGGTSGGKLRQFGWLLVKAFFFFGTFFAAWLLNSKVACEVVEPAQAKTPAESPAAKAPETPKAEKTATSAPAPAKSGPVAPTKEKKTSPDSPSAAYDGLLYGDLAMTVAERWRLRVGGSGAAPAPDSASLRVRLYDIAIGASALAGPSEDPRRRMEAVAREMFERRRFRVLIPPEGGFGPEEILIDEVLERKAGSPLAILSVYLAAADLLSPPLDLRALALPQGSAARFQDGGITLNALITPADRGPVLRDDLLRARAGGAQGPGAAGFRALTRLEFAGALLRELAGAARSRGESEAALALLGECTQLCPRWKEPWIEISEMARRMGDPARERAAVDGVLALDQEDGRALARRGVLRKAAGDLDGSEKDLRRALEKDPGADPEVFLVLAEIESDRGRIDRAIVAYRRYLTCDPPAALRDLALARIQDLEIRPAVEVLRGPAEYEAKFEALRRISAVRAPASTGALIAALRDGNLRFARLAWRTLRNVTGEEIGFSAEAWESWWEKRGERR